MKIEKCPFCGCKAILCSTGNHFATEKFFVSCGVCGVETPRIARTRKEAIAAWNRRADHLPDATKMVSNADRIRSMSDEELAKIITSDLIGELIPFCQNKYECDAMLTINTIPEEWCMKCALDWLKEEHNEAD